MTEIRSFDSLDQMQQAIAQQRDAANLALHPVQREITYGTCAVGVWYDLLYFGKVQTLAEVEAATRELGEDEDEIQGELESIRSTHELGYMFARWYSLAEPGGEVGDNHRLNLWPISEELFEALRAAGWDPARLPTELQPELGRAAIALASHKRQAGY